MTIKPGKFTIVTSDGIAHITEVEVNTSDLPTYTTPHVYLSHKLTEAIQSLEASGLQVESVRVDRNN